MIYIKQEWHVQGPTIIFICWKHCFNRAKNNWPGSVVIDIESDLRNQLGQDLHKKNIQCSTIGVDLMISFVYKDAEGSECF